MSLSFAVFVGVLTLAVGGLLAIAEGVLTHLSVARAATLADEDGAEEMTLPDLVARREANLGAVVAVRVLSQIGIVVLTVDQLYDHRPSTLGWLAAFAVVAAVLGAVEVLAKTLAVIQTNTWALRVAPIIRLLARIAPLGWLGAGAARWLRRSAPRDRVEEDPSVSEEELLAMAEVAADADVIDLSEQALIESIIEFGDTIVREVMVPRPDMVSVAGTWPITDVMEVIIHNGYSRIPVTGEGIDDIVGIAYAKDLMRAERDGEGDDATGSHIRQARFVPEQQRVSSLLPEMQAESFHMAIVVDEYGGVAGLVTLEDLIEELVGEIVDEFDVEDPMAEPLADGGYRVNARMPVDEVNDLLGADLPDGDWDTVGGLLFGMLGKVPAQGESIETDGYRLTAARVQGRRIGLVRIDLAHQEAENHG